MNNNNRHTVYFRANKRNWSKLIVETNTIEWHFTHVNYRKHRAHYINRPNHRKVRDFRYLNEFNLQSLLCDSVIFKRTKVKTLFSNEPNAFPNQIRHSLIICLPISPAPENKHKLSLSMRRSRNVHTFAFKSHAPEIAFVCGRAASAFRASAAKALGSTSPSGVGTSAVIWSVPVPVLSPLPEKEYKIVQTVHRR